MQNDLAEGEIMASHTPKKLQDQCLESLALAILKKAFPCCINRLTSVYDAPVTLYDVSYKDHDYDVNKAKDPRTLDVILMSTKERETKIYPFKETMMTRLIRIRSWFNRTEWLGGPNSELRRRIRKVIGDKLELLDPYSFIPLFKFLIEAIFSNKVGGCSDAAQFPFMPRVNCELWRKDCPLFADILRSFAPFEIEELSTHHLAFGEPEPLVAVIENSPYLKRVYLRNNMCERLLLSIQKNCPFIEIFNVEKCMGELLVPVNCLYKTFFRGMTYDEVRTFASENSQLEKQRQLSFPLLKQLSVGEMDDVSKSRRRESLSLFIYTLLSFYSQTLNVTSSTLIPFTPAAPVELPKYLNPISYRVLNCSLNGLKTYFDKCSKNDKDVEFPLEKAYQLTFTHTLREDDHIKELIEFSKKWILELQCKTLFVYTWHDIDYEVDISVYGPFFSEIGSILTSFHFNIIGDVDLALLCNVISMCPNLEILRIKITQVHIDSEEKIIIKKMSKLNNLTVHSGEDCVPTIHKLIEKIIESSPELYSLSLVLHDKPCEWLMSLASSKKLNKITILRLSFHCFNFSCREMTNFLREEPVEVPFYVFLIELLSNLKVLRLGSLPHLTFRKLIEIYQRSDLQIGIWHVPPDSKEWYGGYLF
ncbi:uncharacterized protein [Palaemon carinicauda]|uniref:uncharacterized protein n=1 Tax=Palaemon carinicauda TaxID=392227 RepID=UPI0035B58023